MSIPLSLISEVLKADLTGVVKGKLSTLAKSKTAPEWADMRYKAYEFIRNNLITNGHLDFTLIKTYCDLNRDKVNLKNNFIYIRQIIGLIPAEILTRCHFGPSFRDAADLKRYLDNVITDYYTTSSLRSRKGEYSDKEAKSFMTKEMMINKATKKLQDPLFQAKLYDLHNLDGKPCVVLFFLTIE